ncbi:MAG: hypothetical protein WDW38_010417 [Sanguina aurantia]
MLVSPSPACASRLPAFADRAWEALGGGPADLFFPDSFLGVWDVASTLVKVETPLGLQALPDKRVIERAQKEDLNQTLKYQVQFVRNRSGRVVYDRAFNTAALVSTYYDGTIDFSRRITWDVNDPNVLVLEMPRGNLQARTRITRRSQEEPTVGRIETSEFVEQGPQTHLVSGEGPAMIAAKQRPTRAGLRVESSGLGCRVGAAPATANPLQSDGSASVQDREATA